MRYSRQGLLIDAVHRAAAVQLDERPVVAEQALVLRMSDLLLRRPKGPAVDVPLPARRPVRGGDDGSHPRRPKSGVGFVAATRRALVATWPSATTPGPLERTLSRSPVGATQAARRPANRCTGGRRCYDAGNEAAGCFCFGGFLCPAVRSSWGGALAQSRSGVKQQPHLRPAHDRGLWSIEVCAGDLVYECPASFRSFFHRSIAHIVPFSAVAKNR